MANNQGAREEAERFAKQQYGDYGHVIDIDDAPIVSSSSDSGSTQQYPAETWHARIATAPGRVVDVTLMHNLSAPDKWFVRGDERT